MRNLLSADLMRLRHSRVLWLCMAYELYQGLMIFYNASVMAQQGTSRWVPSFQFLWLGGIVFAVYCSFFVSGEYAEGGVRRKVVSGAPRPAVYLANWLSCTAACLLICAFYIVPNWALEYLLVGPAGGLEYIRTPLTAIQGYLDLLEREELSENARRYLGLIQNRMEAMTKLTEELFRYSLTAGQRELVLEPVDLRRCLEECLVSFYAAMDQRGIAPEISLPDGPVVRTLDLSAVSRIFGNIISNALKYSGGDFSASLDGEGRAVFSNAAPGLDPVSAARLFDRFYTVETGRGSTGLGLSIAKLLTERMGGTISADCQDERLYITVAFPKP